MKILYAIQGTGNGHLSRARDIIPILQQKGELDILVSGIQADVELPYPVKYKFKGLSFIFGKNGGIDVIATYKKSNLKQLYKEIKSLPVEEYDLVINDFEPVSAWACKMKHAACIGLSHQAAVINKKSPKPKKKDIVGKAVLHNYAPVTAAYGFHFGAYDKNIFTPVIRSQVRNAKPENKDHYTVYLPAYSDEKIIKVLGEIKNTNWQVFSKHSKKEYKEKNVHIRPINNDDFIESLINCTGILCGAGFETPAEALYLKKKLMAIPMKGQYEQQCNAAALKTMGVPVIKSLKKKHLDKIKAWVEGKQFIAVNYSNSTERIINMIIKKYGDSKAKQNVELGDAIHSVKKLKDKSLGKILNQIAE
ncbi:glycosyltransferase family protein [Ferruginibacter sp. SUN106]|uniref:glycosyltransferase family protein n=1 Tax=Ferruginibacter sp. SUN106 TaxID=2978348 RepID=UPI003D3692EF